MPKPSDVHPRGVAQQEDDHDVQGAHHGRLRELSPLYDHCSGFFNPVEPRQDLLGVCTGHD